MRLSWMHDSRGKVILVLLAVWFTALIHDFTWLKLIYPAISVLTIVLSEAVIIRLRSGNNFFSLSSIVTGLLIGLILDPAGSPWLILAACFFAVIDKQFLRFDIHHHAFNPAAFGIVVSAQLLSGNVAWWAVSWGILPVIILGFGLSWVLRQLHRIFLPITFLLVYFLINLFRTGPLDSFRLIFDGTVFLFAFIMLPEPMTALARGKWQYFWGLSVGVWLFLLTKIDLPVIDPLLAALLIMNLLGFLWSRRRTKSLSGSVSH